MRKNLLAALLCLSAVFVFNVAGRAQGTLLHYWNFNTFATTYTYPAFPVPINADYSRIDPTKATVLLAKFPTASATYHSTSATVMDFGASAPTDYDTVNLRLGATGGNYLRPRNPLDSMYLMFYIPTTNYQHILLTYATESSSFTSGDQYQFFDYSIDSGATWITTGLSELSDSALLTFKRVSVSISNPAVNNNPRLVFRIHFVGRNTGTSGNNRFDNISVDADSIIAPVPIHYWNFNTYATTYTYPHAFPLGPIDADVSAIDTSKARIYFNTFLGTSATWHSAVPTIMDPVATVATDYDTVNLRFGATGGTGIRPRNPLDSAYLYFYIPSTGYHDVIFTYASESSSTTSGDLHQIFDYSVDSGLTWRTSGLSMLQDSAWLVFHRTTVTFTSDSQANNNPKLVFRIHFSGNTSLTSGNNRFDNVSLDGIPYQVSNSITTTAAAYGPFCNAAANNISVAYTSSGTFTGAYAVQLSNVGGAFPSNTTSNLIGTGTGTSPIAATIPSGTAAGNYRVRVVNAAPATTSANDNGTAIVVNAPPAAYNVTGSAAYCAGGTGVAIGLNGSQTGVRYKLFLGGTYLNDSLSGTAAALNFGNMTAGGTYTVTAFNVTTPTCTTSMTGSAIVTVNPLPAAIVGATNTICANNTETLTDATTGGTWISSFPAVATINSTSGLVTALSAGGAAITYTLPTGCATTANIAVNTAVPAIGGTLNVCTGLTSNLSDASGGGTWISSNTSVATVDPYIGILGGVTAGTATVSYTNTIGCVITTVVTINQTPSAITGATSVCVGGNITLSDANTGGSWSISDATAAIGTVTGTVTGVSAGTPTVTYTLPAGCNTTTGIIVNPLPAALTGTAVVCVGATTALTESGGSGSWTSSNNALATVDGSGNISGVGAGSPTITFQFATGCQTTTVVTVNPLPAAITGSNNVCAGLTTTLGESATGGTFTSSSAIATIDPSSGLVNGVTAGSATISYTLPTGCMITKNIVVNPLPAAITGITNACVGQSITLADLTSGGSWSSSTTAVSVDAYGVVTGVNNGTSTITYTLPTGCIATTLVSVNPLSSIVGISSICSGLGGTLYDLTTGGTWSSDNTAALTIDPTTGIFTTMSAGVANITYSLYTGCTATTAFTVAQSPNAISGDSAVCVGITTALSDAGSGTWSSSNTAVATVAPYTGTVTGVSGGSATIVYTLGSGCTAHTTVTVNRTPATITGASVVCQGATITVNDATTGGTWSSNATGIATIDASGIITGVTAGTTSVAYTTLSGCTISRNILVNPLPAPITGIAHFCTGTTSSLADITLSGTWSSSNTAIATVNSFGTISGVSAGTPVVTYTLPTGCYTTIVATVNSLPAVYTVTGGGGYCAGTAGRHIVLSGSQSGIDYQLFYGVTLVGSPVAGTGSAIDFGAQTLAEVYTVVANNGLTACSAHMAGSAPVIVNALPAVHTVTGGGHYCSTGTGVHIGLDGSNVGINYTVYNGGVITGTAVTGTASMLDLGSETAGTYTVVGTNVVTTCSVNMASAATVVEDLAVTPTISLATGIGDIVCGGAPITLTATTTNAGLTPVYSWTVNGITEPVLGSTFTYTPVDGDNVRVSLTSSAACATPATVASNLTLSVLAHGAPAAHIAVTPTTTVCQGTTVDFTSTTSLGGTLPVMSWIVNGAIRGSGPTFSYAPANSDVVSLIIGSDYQCRSADSGTSNTLTMSVMTPTTPAVVVTSNPATISNGESVTLNAAVTNGGTAPSYQWYVNGALVPGASFASYTGNFLDGDSVYVVVTTNGVCSGYSGSGALKIHISHVGVAQVTAAGSNIRMMPNPNNGSFTVKGTIATTGDEAVTLVVTDMLGQVVYTANATAANGNINEQVALGSNLTNGMYLLNVRAGNQNNLFHFVIAK